MKTLYWIAGFLVAALLLRMYFNGVDKFTLQGDYWDVPGGTPHVREEILHKTGAGNYDFVYHDPPSTLN
jgi:hypothetical protein